MNKQELIEAVIELPVDCSGSRPKIDKLTTLELIKLLDEPKKVKVPQFVADWIEKCKAKRKRLLTALLYTPEKVNSWVDDPDNQKLFARAYLDGYEVEKEKRYSVKIRGKIEENLLVYGLGINRYFFARTYDSTKRNEHTREQLEKAGFEWVFDCQGIEIKEVE